MSTEKPIPLPPPVEAGGISETAHSPMPWQAGAWEDAIADANGREIAEFFRDPHAEADAAYALRCVRMHDALCAVCRECLEHLRAIQMAYFAQHGAEQPKLAELIDKLSAALK